MPRASVLAGAVASLAGATAGVALWLTAGALDAIDGPSVAIRVAMLPPLSRLAVYATAGAAAALAVAALVARLSSGRWRFPEAADTDVVLPLFASGLLALPFLPWLTDALPAWTTMASPFVRVVWFVIGGLVARATVLHLIASRKQEQVSRSAGQKGNDGDERLFQQPVSSAIPYTAAIFLVTVAVCGGAATRLVETPIFPGGDEPHYLVIAQSLWRDGDLRIENNHRRGDTFEYFARPLKPDYLTRGVDREIYSIHPVGVAYLLAPVYALGGYRGVVVFLVLLASAAATMAWRVAAHHVGGRAATFGWAACALTAPWVFNSFTVYPEVPAAVAVMAAVTLALRLDAIRDRRSLWLAMFGCGAAIATLPWLSSKYALMGASLGLVAMARLWLPRLLADPDAGTVSAPDWSLGDRLIASAAASLAPLVSGVGWLAFFRTIWGTLSPSAPYGTQHAMDLSYLVAGGPGLFFDQEYGVVAAAPVLLLGLGGLVGMLRHGGRDARLAIEIVLIGVSLLVTVAAFHIWWGGTAAVGRPIISALALLVVPCAWQVRAWSASRVHMAAAWLLLFASLAVMATLAFAQGGLLLVAERDGTSRLLSDRAPAWRLWSLAPTFVVQPPTRSLLITGIWIASTVAAIAVLGRMGRDTRHGRAGLAAAAAAFAALAAVTVAVEPIHGRGAAVRPSDRARQPLLDDFDAGRRPLALVFDPWRRVQPERLPGMFRFAADARTVRPAPAASLLLGARWAWPAGDYDIEIAAAGPLSGELGLQLGRAGPPLVTWAMEGGSRWRGRVTLPIDVGFVGFRGAPDLAAQRPRLLVRPLAVADASRRLPPADVIQSRFYGGAAVFFHDDNADPEPAGFWTRRDRLTRLSLARSDGAPLALRIRSGPAPVRLTLRASCPAAPARPCTASSQIVEIGAEASRDVPLNTAGPVRIEIDTRGGFVPAEINPASRDVRGLGCWVEVMN